MNIAFPLHFDHRGQTATATHDEHIRQMIDQVLFTNPGERVNRPDFGCGVLALTFEPNSDQLAIALQASIQSGLQRWLGDVVEVQSLDVERNEGSLIIKLDYIVIGTRERRSETFQRRVAE